MKVPILSIILFFLIISCQSHSNKIESEQNNQHIGTHYYISRDVAKKYPVEQKIQIINVATLTNEKSRFYLNKPTEIKITTSQLTDYPILIKEVKNAEVDTSNISNNILTITPTDSTFHFSVCRDFSKRNAIFSTIILDKNRDSIIHHAFLMKKETVIGVLKFEVEH